jgi:hypothetical protein
MCEASVWRFILGACVLKHVLVCEGNNSDYAEDIGHHRAELIVRDLCIPGLVFVETLSYWSIYSNRRSGAGLINVCHRANGIGACRCYGAPPTASAPVSN